jgi:two-component system phosphate regulon sensor histidine kinase PhoR
MELSNTRPSLSESERFAALSRIGAALMSERDEVRLLHLIAQTAADLTGAEFAAFTLRPMNAQGELLVPSEGNLFHLAAVVGVTKEQEEHLRRVSLGGEGLLAPIFRYKVPVLVADVLKLMHVESGDHAGERMAARDAAFAFAHGHIPQTGLRAIGIPRSHPVVRSFLGAPLLDRVGEVRGGLLLGHSIPDQFTAVDKEILMGLAAQAAVAVENARLYHAMQMQAQELQAIFASIADGVTLVGPNGQIVRENECAQRLRQQLEGHKQGRQALEALIDAPARSALEGMVERDVSLTLVDEQNEYREFVVNASPLHQLVPQTDGAGEKLLNVSDSSGDVAGAVVVWHDVTENRRLLRERLIHAETEARRLLLQRILDELPSSVYLVHGPDAQLILSNRAAKSLWGVDWVYEQPMIEFLQQHSIQLLRVDGRQLPYDQLPTIQAVRHGTSVHQRQQIIRYQDGSMLPVLVNAIALDTREFPLNFSTTESLPHEYAALVMHQDVSALKEAELLKDEFIGVAAHELRNPLAVLQGFAQLLLVQSERASGAALTTDQQESLEGIVQSARRLGELTDDLLDVTRLQAGRLQLHREPTDLVALARRVVKRFQMTAKHHRCVVAAQTDVLVVSIDVQRIEQVVNNILNNAVKYSPQADHVQITLFEDDENHCAVVNIKDDGIGIPEKQQMRIFGRFMRADNARAHGIHGTGLGLYLSRELVERHGGRIWFESVEGQGTTFFISIPLLSEDEGKEQTLSI